MRIGIDLSGVDDKNEIISFLNTFYEKDVTIVSYGIPQDLNFIKKLLSILNLLADLGNTIVIIEHNLDVIKSADYVIDLGPEGGELGGNIIIKGEPEEIISCEKSYTGKYLKKLL